MQCTLNFSDQAREAVLAFLRKFPGKKTKTMFELFRCTIGESSVTLYTSGKVVVQGADCEMVEKKILEAVDLGKELVLGVDEAGRGENFGPFVIAAVLGRPGKLRQLRDSKREKQIGKKAGLVEKNALAISVFSIGSQQLGMLHERGISLNQIEARIINAWRDFFIGLDKGLKIVVDGRSLKGCKKGVSFLVGGDDLNPVVGAASVVARNIRLKSADREKRTGWGSWRKKKSLW